MMEFTLFVPHRRLMALRPELETLTSAAGGCTTMCGIGSWTGPDGTRVSESVVMTTYIVSLDTPARFMPSMRAAVRRLHALGEHTVLVRRLSGRGIAHFWLKAGEEDQL